MLSDVGARVVQYQHAVRKEGESGWGKGRGEWEGGQGRWDAKERRMQRRMIEACKKDDCVDDY